MVKEKIADLALVRYYTRKLGLDPKISRGESDYSESAEWTPEGRVKISQEGKYGLYISHRYEEFFDKDSKYMSVY